MKQAILTAAIVSTIHSGLYAAAIPLDLPRPNGQPGNASKPAKVYILAGVWLEQQKLPPVAP